MILTFPIVGIRHCLPEESVEDFILALPDSTEVALVYDNANAYDRYAIQAWMELSVDDVPKKMQVGYVASDYAPLIRANYTSDAFLYARVVHPDTSMVEETSFEVELEVNKLTLPLLPPRIDRSDIANIALPMVSPEKKMVFQDIIAYSRGEIDASVIVALAKKSAPYFGYSLSGDERSAYILLSGMLVYAHSLWTDMTDEIWDLRMTIDGKHRDVFKSPECCAAVMDTEMHTLRQQTESFFQQYTDVLKAGLITKEDEIQNHTQWLTALPDNLYAWIKDKPKFASKLYYERFSMEELQAIYLHLLCLDWLKHQKVILPMSDSTRKRIEDFPYWDPYMEDYTDREDTFFRLQRAWNSTDRYPVASLALEIKKMINHNRIEPPDKLSKFTTAINALLETDIKPNSLAKHLRTDR